MPSASPAPAIAEAFSGSPRAADAPSRPSGIPTLLHQADRLVFAGLCQAIGGQGLTRTDADLLCHLAVQDGITMLALAEAALLKQTTLTKAIDRLESAGLVTRRRSPQDGRLKLIRLTKAGRQVAMPLKEAASRHTLMIEAAFGDGPSRQLKSALAVLIKKLSAISPRA